MSKVVTLDDAVAIVEDGASIGTGGVLMTRKPVGLLDAIVRAGRRDLTIWTMLGSMDVELLAAHGALAAAGTIYVGFEQHGFPPAYDAAVARGEVRACDHSELVFVAGLRASLAGLPFLPTRGAVGSQIAEDLGLRDVECPYTGERLVAAPAIRPDVALLHAEVADEHGNVPIPPDRDFLYDYDATLARACGRVIVGVERLASEGELAERPRQLLLFGHEVDAVVVMPGGARPTAVPGVYPADLPALQEYLTAAQAGDGRAVLDRLLAA